MAKIQGEEESQWQHGSWRTKSYYELNLEIDFELFSKFDSEVIGSTKTQLCTMCVISVKTTRVDGLEAVVHEMVYRTCSKPFSS